jgi:nucleoside-diphosphate-sugar epimerase
MRIVVTGALGHIGSQLIRDLPSTFAGAEIVMLDDLSTQRYCSLFDLPAEGRYRFIEADVLTADLASLFSGADAVVHLAAITDATSSFENQAKVEEVNFAGTQRVARACLDAGCALIFPSTTSVYGTQAEIVDEDCPAAELKPQSPYAESKLKAEGLLQSLGASEGLHFVICRFGTIFGASVGMRFHTAINKFCWQAVMGQPITVWRTALNQNRPYLELGDGIRSLKFILQKGLYDGNLYNVVTVNTSVKNIVDIIRTHIPDLEIQYIDTRIMNQLSYHVSNQLFRNLGFEFEGDLEKGIGETIQLLRNAGQALTI